MLVPTLARTVVALPNRRFTIFMASSAAPRKASQSVGANDCTSGFFANNSHCLTTVRDLDMHVKLMQRPAGTLQRQFMFDLAPKARKRSDVVIRQAFFSRF